MKKFEQPAVCDKCLNTEGYISESSSSSCPHLIALHPGVDIKYQAQDACALKCRCRKCGWIWQMKTADAKE